MPAASAASSAPGAVRWSAAHVVALGVLCTAQLMQSVDVTVVNVALPSMQEELGFSNADLHWVVSAYVVLFGGFLLLGGRCGDVFGKRRMLICGVAAFTGASFVCGVADSSALLVAGRAAQGLAAAFIAPATLGLIVATFAEGRSRGRALGIWGSVTGLSASAGVILGGALASGPGWRWIFWVNVPLGIALVWAARRFLPEVTTPAAGKRVDLPGAAAVTVGVLLLVFSAANVAGSGWSESDVLLPLALGAAVLAWFVVREVRLAAGGLVPLDVFASRSVSAANVTAVLIGSGMLSMFFFLSLYQQDVMRLSAFETGLSYLPLTGLLMLFSYLAPVAAARFGTRMVLAVGCGLAAAGMALLGRASPDSGVFLNVIGPSLVIAPGLALTFVPLTAAAVDGVRADLVGIASGLANASRTAGGALGLAAISALVMSQVRMPNGGQAARHDLDAAIGTGFLACAGLMTAAALCALLLFPSLVPKPSTPAPAPAA